jgi:hypothetical protein
VSKSKDPRVLLREISQLLFCSSRLREVGRNFSEFSRILFIKVKQLKSSFLHKVKQLKSQVFCTKLKSAKVKILHAVA